MKKEKDNKQQKQANRLLHPSNKHNRAKKEILVGQSTNKKNMDASNNV